MSATRRTVLAALPLATVPDFSTPLATPTRSPDAELIALCEEHDRQWAIAADLDASDDVASAATAETTRLNMALCAIPARTLAGFRAKATVLVRETGNLQLLAGLPIDLSCTWDDQERVLLSLLVDLIGTHAGAVA